ncbi:hypothetical protein [Paraburkholderia sp. HD33-4]|uniref:hypothetical protein n=1 Tax=Paraburkholderia sp. HD33-4 TaxID=2883242 RepID=UPI001F2C4299|nr:hypothetical protein [Paraburkholderia sp. HD33-4]
MDSLPSIAENFERYRATELPEEMSPEAVAVLRNAFYQGVGSTLWMVDKVKRTADTPAVGLLALENLNDEYRLYERERIAALLGDALVSGRVLGGDGVGGVFVLLRRREE